MAWALSSTPPPALPVTTKAGQGAAAALGAGVAQVGGPARGPRLAAGRRTGGQVRLEGADREPVGLRPGSLRQRVGARQPGPEPARAAERTRLPAAGA